MSRVLADLVKATVSSKELFPADPDRHSRIGKTDTAFRHTFCIM